MFVQVKGGKFAPNWETLQQLVRDSLNIGGNFTRIARRDGGCNYAAHGLYDVIFVPEVGDEILVVVEVLS